MGTDGRPADRIRDHALELTPADEAIETEDSLWWIQGRKAIIRRYLNAMQERRPITTLMDVGCGSGGTMDVLAEFGRVLGVEPSAALAARARSRGVAETVFEAPFQRVGACRTVDVFTLFDVLEHIEDDRGFLSDLRRCGPARHQVLVSVPAVPWLYGKHDRILHHHRRYDARMLRSLVRDAGYVLVHESYFMSLLFPLVLASRAKEAIADRLGRGEEGVNLGGAPPLVGRVLEATLRLEARLSRRDRLPIGLWLFAQLRTLGT